MTTKHLFVFKLLNFSKDKTFFTNRMEFFDDRQVCCLSLSNKGHLSSKDKSRVLIVPEKKVYDESISDPKASRKNKYMII